MELAERIFAGSTVLVELTEDKRTGKLTGGKVKEVLTTSPNHPHGIKVRLESGQIGRIKQIIQNRVLPELNLY